MTKLNSYELLLMLRPDVQEEDRAAVIERTREIITGDQGTINRIDEWGKKRLAYEIDDLNEGFYYLLRFQAAPKTIDEITRVFKISDTVMRSLCLREEHQSGYRRRAAAAATQTPPEA